MNSNFKLSTTECRAVLPYNIKNINIYSIEEAIYIFYNNWKEFSNEFFEESFINWVKNELLDINLFEKLSDIKTYDSFYQKSIEFLTINDFYTLKEIEKISLELFNWEKRGQSKRLKALGDRFFSENLFNKAIKFYLDAIDFEPTSSILYNNIGICYIRIKKYNLSLEYLKKAFELDKLNFKILYNLLEACILNDSKEDFNIYINYAKDEALYYYLAEHYFFNKDYNKALVNYRKSYLFKRDYKIIIKICDVHIKLLNYNKALEAINFLGEEEFDILIKKSEIYENMKNYSMAIKCLEKANFYEKDNAQIWLNLATLYRLEYEFTKAEGAIFKANSILPDNEKILFEQALIKNAQGKFKEYQAIIFKIIKKAAQNYRNNFT